MFARAKGGWDIILSAVQAFLSYPQLLVPLLVSWVFYAGTTLYFYFSFDWKAHGTLASFGIAFGILLFFSTFLCFSACWLIEMIGQIETDRELSVSDALGDTLRSHFTRMLPVAFVWASIWFVLFVVDVLTSKAREDENESDRELSFENATRVLAGDTNSEVSWLSLTLDMLKKLTRMLAFLSLPAICWQGMDGIKAMEESLRTAKTHIVEFLSGYALSGVVAAIVFLPAALPIFLDSEELIDLPDKAWPVLLVYVGLAWSFAMYIEQMFTAELYLWHLNWRRAVQQARSQGLADPKLAEVKRPSLLDGVADLNVLTSNKPIPVNQALYRRRVAKEALGGIKGPVKFDCAHCSHQFQFKNAKELQLFDYDMSPENGVQIKCPACGKQTTFGRTAG